MLESLKQEVYEANLLLPKHGLVAFTWGNVSGIDRDNGLMVIKPSGVEYSKLMPEDMVVVELQTGKAIKNSLKPSSDSPTHLELYRSFTSIGGIVHTHSIWASVFAQAMRPIPTLGTTHADYFNGDIPCTRELSVAEINGNYEAETGRVIAECFSDLGLSPMEVPASLVARHGPFIWGENSHEAVHNAAVLEIVAKMAWHTIGLADGSIDNFPRTLLNKHYKRKHGSEAYYGQG